MRIPIVPAGRGTASTLSFFTGRSIRDDRNAGWVKPAFAQIARVMKPDTLLLSFYGWTAIDIFMEAWRDAGLRPVDHMVAYKAISLPAAISTAATSRPFARRWRAAGAVR